MKLILTQGRKIYMKSEKQIKWYSDSQNIKYTINLIYIIMDKYIFILAKIKLKHSKNNKNNQKNIKLNL